MTARSICAVSEHVLSLLAAQNWHDIISFACCCRGFRLAACRFAKLQKECSNRNSVQNRDFPLKRRTICAATAQVATCLRSLKVWRSSARPMMEEVDIFFCKACNAVCLEKNEFDEILRDISVWVLQRDFNVQCATGTALDDNFALCLINKKNENDCFYLSCSQMHSARPPKAPKVPKKNVIRDDWWDNEDLHCVSKKAFSSPFEDFPFF
mmetsp:Transcript_31407/g.45993  ORF Transcript_31407/g.45993 Transcript_31407/m.45993 type:complete len:210 (-) Transcript_31407:227-856(-)